MSRVSKYIISIERFIKSKSCFSDSIKNNPTIDKILSLNDHISSIVLLTILNSQYKRKQIKLHNGYYAASSISLLASIAYIQDNIEYYDNLFGSTNVRNYITKAPIYAAKCISQTIESLETITEKEKVLRINHKVTDYMHKKLIELTEIETLTGTHPVNKCDIMTYNFNDKATIEAKYKTLKRIDRDQLLAYVDRKFGSIYQCGFVMGWLFGLGDDKTIPEYEKLGSSLGLLIKLANDFGNLERDIISNSTITHNLLLNLGVHECFALFIDNKIKLLEGCMVLDVYGVTIKEIIDHVEKLFDGHLKNTDIDLKSRYSDVSKK